MRNSKKQSTPTSYQNEESRPLVIITGYYGFDNLGDEAILEELLHELGSIWNKDNIVVLSNNPEKTTAVHAVQSVNRWHWYKYINLFKQAKLLVSGGGGLFQDRTGVLSVAFYASQIFLGRLLGVKVFIYAQGLGPLNSAIGRKLTELAFKQAQIITLRDIHSIDMLESWNVKGQLTSDPVWMLSPSPLPIALQELLAGIKGVSAQNNKIIGLSLRSDPKLKNYHLEFLAEGIVSRFSAYTILLLPFQPEQDLIQLQEINGYLKQLGLKTHLIDSTSLTQPSQWLTLIENLDLVIGMRLHALLMALQTGKPVIGIAYDPKVSTLLNDFQQPLLSLDSPDRENSKTQWLKIISEAKVEGLSEYARQKLATTKELASQNTKQLHNILEG